MDGQRSKEWLRFEFRLTNTFRVVLVSCLDWKVNLRRVASAAGGVDQRELGGDLDSAAAAGVEAGIEDVGADVLVVVADQGEVGDVSVECF
jgi:hypothetical protein